MTANRPPHRSQRAELPHWALISGPDSKALLRPRMNNAGTRKPLLREPIHPRPVEAAALASSPKRLEPAMRNLRPEHVERLDVGWHAVIRVMTAQHSTQPFTLRDDRFMQTTTQFESDLMNLRRQPRTYRMT